MLDPLSGARNRGELAGAGGSFKQVMLTKDRETSPWIEFHVLSHCTI